MVFLDCLYLYSILSSRIQSFVVSERHTGCAFSPDQLSQLQTNFSISTNFCTWKMPLGKFSATLFGRRQNREEKESRKAVYRLERRSEPDNC